jgi:heptaprenyl diphosphate synthase
MTAERSEVVLDADASDVAVARLAALAIGLAAFEAALPSPIPGVKPGLANVITLLAWAQFGWRTAAWVSLLRVIAVGILFGSLLTPGFFLSLAGALSSLLVLAPMRWLPRPFFGLVTISVVCAFAHVAGQLALVYAWWMPAGGVLALMPVFAWAALLFGVANGLACAALLQRRTDLAAA